MIEIGIVFGEPAEPGQNRFDVLDDLPLPKLLPRAVVGWRAQDLALLLGTQVGVQRGVRRVKAIARRERKSVGTSGCAVQTCALAS